MQSRGYIYQPSNAYDNPSGSAIPAPSDPLLLWRPSSLVAAEDESVALLEDEGSLGWDLTPVTANIPIFQTIGGIPSLRYSGAAGNLCTGMGSPTVAAHSLPVATGLFIFNPTNNITVATSYLGDTSSGERIGAACQNSSNLMFGYRGLLLATPTPKPAINTWHYVVIYFNGASSHINLNGNQIGTGNAGAYTLIRRYQIGAYDTTTTYRFIGNIANVGFWEGDRRTDVEAYARTILGLP